MMTAFLLTCEHYSRATLKNGAKGTPNGPRLRLGYIVFIAERRANPQPGLLSRASQIMNMLAETVNTQVGDAWSWALVEEY
jgi:hypothetical protein